jgi:phosphoserine phosphatase
VTDWSGVPFNACGCPLGYVRLTPAPMPGIPIYVAAESLVVLQEDGCNTAVITGSGRMVVKENIQEVFRRKARANTVEVVKSPPPVPPVIYPEPAKGQIRKKA